MRDVEALGLQEGDEQLPAFVLSLARGDTVRDGDDTGFQPGSFVFSSSTTSVTDISLSIAFAMS